MFMLEPVVLRSLPSETPPSATACTFPVEGISINFLVVAIAVLTLLALKALPSGGATALHRSAPSAVRAVDERSAVHERPRDRSAGRAFF
ncbi:hypothetical protein [Sorangium cellulosum]|uniref:hypothetical protein n=1 Tax=Sorangium cellulosum TaxID=56 RepID=UPI0012DB5ACA|nr:hypothetical protein [Sorangium cellulosum]